jgi:hypothetical protein
MSSITGTSSEIRLAQLALRRRAARAAVVLVALSVGAAALIAQALDARDAARESARRQAAIAAKVAPPERAREWYREWLEEPTTGSWAYYRDWADEKR